MIGLIIIFHFIQADVLETQYAELEDKIKKSKDFEQIRRAHESFLNKIQSQSFMLNKIVNNNSCCLIFVSNFSILVFIFLGTIES